MLLSLVESNFNKSLQDLLSYLLNYSISFLVLGCLIFALAVSPFVFYKRKSKRPGRNNTISNTNNNNTNNNNNNNNSNNNNNNNSRNNRVFTPPIYTIFDRSRAYDNMRVRFTVSPRDELVIREDLQFRAIADTSDGAMARYILNTVNITRPFHIQRSVLGSHIRAYQVWPNEQLYVELGFANHGTWTGRPNIVVFDGINRTLHR